MSTEEDKFKHSKRLHKDEVAIKKQAKIAKEHGAPVKEPHRLHKHHAMDCGNPGCYLCGNARQHHGRTVQEKKFLQTEKWSEE
jgi:hypothetical protein